MELFGYTQNSDLREKCMKVKETGTGHLKANVSEKVKQLSLKSLKEFMNKV